jgi:hypothetical protein
VIVVFKKTPSKAGSSEREGSGRPRPNKFFSIPLVSFQSKVVVVDVQFQPVM